MNENEAHVWIALVGMIGSIAASIIAAIGSYLAQRARQDIHAAKTAVRDDISAVKTDLAYNTQQTNETNTIVNGQRDHMVAQIAQLESQFAAVTAALALERKTHPESGRVVDRVVTAVEAAKDKGANES